jgi:LysM repeat protein
MYSFFIDGVQLPIAPAKLQTRISNNNKTITLINEGEVNILKKAGLTEIAVEVMIPQVQYPFAAYQRGFRDAEYYLSHLESLKVNLKKFQFIVSRVSAGGSLLFDTNMTVSLEDYTIIEDAKEGLDVTVSIKLKQYVNFGAKEVIIKSDPVTQKVAAVQTTVKREAAKVVPKTHKVVAGDSLWAICKKELGDGSKYPEIAKLNGIKNPSLISVGQVIKLG